MFHDKTRIGPAELPGGAHSIGPIGRPATEDGLLNQLLQGRTFREHLSLARFTDDLVSC